MKILLDENLPHDLRTLLTGHEVFTAAFMGWAGIRNGVLLGFAGDAGFDLMIKNDLSVRYPQYLPSLAVAVLVPHSPTNKIEDIEPLVPRVIDLLRQIKPRTIVDLR